jgi:hypothetical protein
MTNITQTAFSLLPAALFVGLALAASPAGASGESVTAEIYFHADGTFSVVEPVGWACITRGTPSKPLLTGPGASSASVGGTGIGQHIVFLASAPEPYVELHCAPQAATASPDPVPMCGTVTAGVNQQTGGVGETSAIAICGSAQGVCHAYYTPVTVPADCSVSITGTGPAACAFVTTVNLNYNRVGYCNFPVI